MQVVFLSASNPQWLDEAHTAIHLTANFEHTVAEYPGGVNFCATMSDCEAHGRELFQRALQGEFGEIAPYVPPPQSFFEAQVRAYRNTLLQQSDWTQLPDTPIPTKEIWATYRQALRDIPLQAGFPYSIDYPTPP